MKRHEWISSSLIIFVLLALSILVAQSRRNCEVPGSSIVPCIWGKPLKPQTRTECEKVGWRWESSRTAQSLGKNLDSKISDRGVAKVLASSRGSRSM